MAARNVIVFDNLRQAHSDIAGETKKVKAISPPTSEHFTQQNAKGSLYHPRNLKDVSKRAQASGELFREMFTS